MKRLFVCLLALCLVLTGTACNQTASTPDAPQESPAVTTPEPTATPEPTEAPLLKLVAGAYYPESGAPMLLYESKDGNRAGILPVETEGALTLSGISWTDDSLSVEREPIAYTVSGQTILFTYLGKELSLTYRTGESIAAGSEEQDPLGLGDTVYGSVYGETADFRTDGFGTISVAEKVDTPFLWGYYGSGEETVPYIVMDGSCSNMALERGILMFHFADEQGYALSVRHEKEIAGTAVESSDNHYRIILSNTDWTRTDESAVDNYMRSDNLAFFSLYSASVSGTPDIENIDSALHFYVTQLNGTETGEINDCPVGGLIGRSIRAKLELQGFSWETEAVIFHHDSTVYYFICAEYEELSDDTLAFTDSVLDSFQLID